MDKLNDPITEKQKAYLLNITFNSRPGTPKGFIGFIKKLNPDEFGEKIGGLTKGEASDLISKIISGEFEKSEELIIDLMMKGVNPRNEKVS